MATVDPGYRTRPFLVHRVNEIQFDVSLPRLREGKLRGGGWYVDLAEARSDRSGRMDWDNKLVFLLSHKDTQLIRLRYLRSELPVKIVHDYKGVKSTLTVEAGKVIDKGDLQGFMSFKWTLGKNGRYVSIYVDEVEMEALFEYWSQTCGLAYGHPVADVVKQVGAPMGTGRNYDDEQSGAEYGQDEANYPPCEYAGEGNYYPPEAMTPPPPPPRWR